MQVDSVLQKHPDVAEAATFPIPEPMMGQVPESVVVLTNEHKVAVEDAPKEIRKYAADNLQDYKVSRLVANSILSLVLPLVPQSCPEGQ